MSFRDNNFFFSLLFTSFFPLQKDVKDIYTPVKFEVSYGLRETSAHRSSSKGFPAIKPILQQSAGHSNTIANQVPANVTQRDRAFYVLYCKHSFKFTAIT